MLTNEIELRRPVKDLPGWFTDFFRDFEIVENKGVEGECL